MMEKKPVDRFIASQIHPNDPEFFSFHVVLTAANLMNSYAFSTLRGTQYANPPQSQRHHVRTVRSKSPLAVSQPAGSVSVASPPFASQPATVNQFNPADIQAQIMYLMS